MRVTVTIRRDALPAWHALQRALRAAAPVPCTTDDPAAWTSGSAVTRAAAARRCHGCPVAAECGRFAEANREHHGVWAGVDRETGTEASP